MVGVFVIMVVFDFGYDNVSVFIVWFCVMFGVMLG